MVDVDTEPAVDAAPAPAGTDRSAPTRRRWPRPARRDLAVAAGYLLAALYVSGHLWLDPVGRVQKNNNNDQAFFEFVLAHGMRVVFHGDNPFFAPQMNVPFGVNLMANTSILGISIPLAPITYLFGPPVSYAVLLTGAMAGTAFAWYWVLSRHFVSSRTAAWVGGWFCGFAPGMMAQANGHPNIVAQFAIPLILWRLIKLREPGHAVRNGVALALLVIWQAFINEEMLFITALGFAIFLVVYGLIRRKEIRDDLGPFLRGGAVAVAVVLVVLGYPLYFQFFGAQHYRGLPQAVQGFGADLASFPAYSSESLAGNPGSIGHLAQNAAEENAFFGWPLLVVLLAIFWRGRRNPVVLGLTAVTVVFGLFSLGPQLVVRHKVTHITGPWQYIRELPLFDSVVPTRFALVLAPLVGLLLAVGCEEFARWWSRSGAAAAQGAPIRMLWYGLLAVALIPIAPTPLPAMARTPMPAFVTDGTWKRYVPAGRTLVTAPLPRGGLDDGIFYAADAQLGFAIPRGYFIGPEVDPADPKKLGSMYGAPARPTSNLLETVYFSGNVPVVSRNDQENAVQDLRFWRAAVVVVAPQPHEEALWKTVTQLLGFQPTWVDGVWLWDVRNL